MLGPEPPEPRDLVEQMYCMEQIYIPPTFPYILKNWMKAAIRTQPSDLLKWSSAYFRALAEHREPPVKTIMEYPEQHNAFHLTPGFIRILSIQLGDNPEIALNILWKRWDGVCLPVEGFQHILELGLFQGEVIPTQLFIAVACALISKNLVSTMILFCDSLTKEPEGGSASIPYELFKETYVFLARLDNGPEPIPISPLPSNIEIVQEMVKQKKSYIEREIHEEYIQCPGALGEVHDLPAQENIGPFISWSGSTIEPPEQTMGQRYCLEIFNHLVELTINVCERRELDGIVGMNKLQADHKMIYPIVDSILWIIFPEPSISELSWSSTYTVTLQGEEEEEQEKIKKHFHIPGIGPRVSYIQIQRVLDFIKDWASRQEGMVLKRNLRHVLCPPLDFQIESFDINNDTRGIRPCPTEQCKTL